MTRSAAWAATGYAVFALAYALAWRVPEGKNHIDADAAHRKALQAAQQVLGRDLSALSWTVRSRYDEILDSWQQQNAATALDRAVSPWRIEVAMVERRNQTRVELSSDGRVVAIVESRQGARREQPEVDPETQKQIAEKAFQTLAGDLAPQFARAEDTRLDRYEWTASNPVQPSLKWAIRANFNDWGLQEARLVPQFQDEMRSTLARQTRWAEGRYTADLRRILMTIAVGIAIWFYVTGWIRGIMDHRIALVAGGLYWLTAFVAQIFGADSWENSRGSLWSAAGEAVFPAMCMGFVAGAGRVAASTREWPRWTSFAMLLRGPRNSKSIGRAIVAGLSWAGGMAAIGPVLALLSRSWGGSLRVDGFMDAAMVPSPLVAVLHPLVGGLTLGVFAMLLPMMRRRIEKVKTAYAVLVPLAALAYFVEPPPVSAGIAVAILCALLTAAAHAVLYWRQGLLATLVGAKASGMLLMAGAFGSSGQMGLALSAAGLLAVLAAAGLAGLVLARGGTDFELPDDRRIRDAYLSEREKLKADFSMAHQAQRRLLPVEAPSVAGFSMAAVCQPARDVGGDLYDYFPLPDGRLGVCVADVSGKGMAAALYMTLTKGVIAAAAPDCKDLAVFCGHLNRHLYAACRRKVFVTAVVAALDPVTRTIEYIRAGHNPLLLKKAGTGEARYLNPPGMGFGMTASATFGRVTQAVRVTLEPGDVMVLYSDGVTEAMNEQLEEYGEERLRNVVDRAASQSAAGIVAAIQDDVAGFTGTEPAHDDVTILVVQAVAA